MQIPEELKQLNRWVCYRLVPDKKSGKPKKMPVNPVTGQNAKSNDPSSWTDFETASEAVDKYGFTGIGFMFTLEDGYVGVDIDHCYDRESGTFNDTAAAILGRQPTYAEYSPSGDGVHLWFKGKKPDGSSKNTETGVEMYDSVRYFTVTGNPLPNASMTIAEALPDTLSWIHGTYIEKQKGKKKKKAKSSAPVKLTDEEVLEKAQSSGDAELFCKLWSGEWSPKYPSQSEADIALCMKLAFWSGKDREQMDRLFRQSGLYRDKWDEKHHADGSTYGEETLNKAIETVTEVYHPGNASPIVEYEGQYFRIKGDNFYPITNFLITPVEMIVSEEETQLTADFVTTRNETYRLTLMTTDFANQQKFKNLLNSRTISLAYYGGDGDLELLKSYISELEWVQKTGVKAMGVYSHNGRAVFASADGSVEADGTSVEDIVQLERYRSIESGILGCDPLTADKLKTIGSVILYYNEPAKTVSILAWTAGCFIKQHLRKEGVKYPHLFLIGEAGSGKSTTLERVILPVFSTTKVTAATQVTQFTLMKESASSNIIPLPLDEFKPSKIDRLKIHALYNHFRDSYDGHNGVRGRADQSIVMYQLLAPLVVAGEESADEAAIRERSIELLFSKKDLKKPENKLAFNRVTANADTLGDLGRTLLNAALKTESKTVKSWYKEGLGLFAKELPSRVISNLACCYAGLKLLESVCASYRLSWDDVFPLKFDPCVRYLEFAAHDYLLDGGMNNRSIVEQTFEIMARMQLDPKTDYALSDDKAILYIRLNQIYDRYTKYRKDFAITGEVLPYGQFKKQLMHSDVFLQQNVQRKFNGVNARCWVVDFSTLSARCDVGGFDTTDIVPLTGP